MIEFYDLGKYIRAFDETTEGRKTKVYSLCSQKNELVKLGFIKWYGAWRQYCFFPEHGTVFNKECLNDIQCFLNKLNEKKGEEKWII